MIEVQAVVALPFSNILAALGQWPDKRDILHRYGDMEEAPGYTYWCLKATMEPSEVALPTLEAMRAVDSEQAMSLLNLESRFRLSADASTRIGLAVGRLCDDVCPLVPRLIEMLESLQHGVALMAATALSTAAARSPEAKWLLQHEEAERIRSWSFDITYNWDQDSFIVERLLEPAIILLGATGDSESMEWLAWLAQSMDEESNIGDAFALARKLFLARGH